MNSVLHRLQTLLVADVMAREVVEISDDQLMGDVASLFVENGISAAPVIDAQGICVGVLSATDFLKRESQQHDADGHKTATFTGAEPENGRDEKVPVPPSDAVTSHMTSAVQTVPHTSLLLTAARMMCSQHLHRLIVLDDEGRTAGVVSTMDVVAALMNAFDEVKARI